MLVIGPHEILLALLCAVPALLCIKQWHSCTQYSPALVFLTCPSSLLCPALSVLIQKTSELSLRCSCWQCCDTVLAHVMVWHLPWCHQPWKRMLLGGKCPSDLQHCLWLFLSCPPFLVLLNPLGQPRALCFPAAEGVGKAFMTIHGEIWFVEHWWQVVEERRMRRSCFLLQHLTALLAGLGAFLGFVVLNSRYFVRKHSFPPWCRKQDHSAGAAHRA